MKVIHLEMILMPNVEMLFNGRSLGFLTKEEQAKYIKESKDV